MAIQLYAQTFPRRVRALVGDGNMDHQNLRGPWDWMNAGIGALEDNFVRFADWCDTTTDPRPLTAGWDSDDVARSSGAGW
ncbi:hypothetical protein ACIBSV_11385 [Embleya sp. NPDC050154]|uniref:hypothetical protein n=1 Tax=unclassified Embleya TaxID=2699296 RepID=UPI0037BAFF09